MEIAPGDIFIRKTAVNKIEGFSYDNGEVGVVYSKGAGHQGIRYSDGAILIKASQGKYKVYFRDIIDFMRKGDVVLIPQGCQIMKAIGVWAETVHAISLYDTVNHYKTEKSDIVINIRKYPIDSIDVVVSPRGHYDKITFKPDLHDIVSEIIPGL